MNAIVPPDFEPCLCAFAEEIYGGAAVADKRDENIALFFEQAAHLAALRHSEPVQVFSEDCRAVIFMRDAVLARFSEIKDIDAYIKPFLFAPCENIPLELVKVRLFCINDHIDG